MALSKKTRNFVVVGIVLAGLGLLLIAGGVFLDSDSSDDKNPVVASTSSNSLDEDRHAKMELNSTRADGTKFCVSFAANGEQPNEVKLKNCGPTKVELDYDDVAVTLDPGKNKTIELDYDYTEFAVDIKSLDGTYIGGFQP